MKLSCVGCWPRTLLPLLLLSRKLIGSVVLLCADQSVRCSHLPYNFLAWLVRALQGQASSPQVVYHFCPLALPTAQPCAEPLSLQPRFLGEAASNRSKELRLGSQVGPIPSSSPMGHVISVYVSLLICKMGILPVKIEISIGKVLEATSSTYYMLNMLVLIVIKASSPHPHLLPD